MNDIDGEIVNFFRILRNRSEELQRVIELPNPAKAWAELPETIGQAAERLKGVQIENLPAVELIQRYDTEDVFIYADPPYLHGTRKNYLVMKMIYTMICFRNGTKCRKQPERRGDVLESKLYG